MKDSKFIDKFAAFAGRLGNQIHLKPSEMHLRQ